MHGDDGYVATDRPESRPGHPEGDDGFDLLEWLDVDRTPDTAPAGTDPDEATARTIDSASVGFVFTGWPASGEGDHTVTEDSGTVDGPPASRTDGSWGLPAAFRSTYRPAVHPTMVATFALFLTAATLAVLTVGGVIPPLGPVTGLPS